MKRAARGEVIIVGALMAVLFVGACSNDTPSTPGVAPTTVAPTTVPPTTVPPTTVPSTTVPAFTTDGRGSATTWIALFLVAVALAVVLSIAARRSRPHAEVERLQGEVERLQGEVAQLQGEVAQLQGALAQRQRQEPLRRAPSTLDFPPTIGDEQPSAREEPLLQPSAATPSDVFVHAGKVRRKRGRDLVVRAASVRGTASRLERKERQDAYSFVARGGHLIVAVADGVGSLPHSGIAARLAARVSCLRVEKLLDTSGELDDASIAQVFESTAWEVVLAARKHAGNPDLPVADAARSMATTLVVGAIDFRSPRELSLTVARLGDSSAWLLAGRKAVALFGADAAGEVVDTNTLALPGLSAEGVEVAHRTLHPDDVLVVATDGFAGSWGNGDSEVADYFGRAWRQPPDHVVFAGQVAYRRSTFDDDRTAVAVWV